MRRRSVRRWSARRRSVRKWTVRRWSGLRGGLVLALCLVCAPSSAEGQQRTRPSLARTGAPPCMGVVRDELPPIDQAYQRHQAAAWAALLTDTTRDDEGAELYEGQPSPSECRARAAQALRHYGAAGLPYLIAALERNASIEAVDTALVALMALGGPGARADLAVLAVAERGRSLAARRRAVRILGAPGPATARLATHLAPFVSDDDAEIRSAAVQALVATGASPSSALAALLTTARDTIPRVRAGAFRLLAAYGAAAAPALRDIVAGLAHPDTDVRAAATVALGGDAGEPRIGDAPPRPGLVSVLGAAPEIVGAIPLLVRLLGDTSGATGTWVTAPVVATLRALGGTPLPQYRAALHDQNERTRAAVAALLAQMEFARLTPTQRQQAQALLPALRAIATQDPDPTVRQHAADAATRLQSLRSDGR